MKIDIPRAFALYNEDKRDPGSQKGAYSDMLGISGNVADCIGCGQCEGICPQHLPIIENLREVAEYFEC